MKLFKKFISEFIGTFGLIGFGCGVAIYLNQFNSTTTNQATNTLLIALAFGLAAMCLTYAFGSTSGAHLNPAISFGVLLKNFLKPEEKKKFTIIDFLIYIIAQILGAFLGCFALYELFDKCDFAANQTTNLLQVIVGNNYYKLSAFTIETLLSLCLVFVFLLVNSERRNQGRAGVVIGLTVALVHIFGIPFTGTSVNPARSISTAFFASWVNGNNVPLQELWIYIVGPLLGALIAFLLYWLLSYKNNEENEDIVQKQRVVVRPQQPRQNVQPQQRSQQQRPNMQQRPQQQGLRPQQSQQQRSSMQQQRPNVQQQRPNIQQPRSNNMQQQSRPLQQSRPQQKNIIIIEHTKPRRYAPELEEEVIPTVTPVTPKKEIEPTVIFTSPAVQQKEEKKKLKIKRVSFQTKLRKADKDLKDKYKTIKAELESYGVKSRISFEGDSYRLHRIKYAFMTIRGKSLRLYLNLDLNKYKDSPIPLRDESDKKKYESTPAVLKVKSDLSARRAVSLIDDIMKEANIEKKEDKNNKTK